jgi:hypothetical protein
VLPVNISAMNPRRSSARRIDEEWITVECASFEGLPLWSLRIVFLPGSPRLRARDTG